MNKLSKFKDRHAQELVPCQVMLVPEAKGKTSNTDPVLLQNIF